MAKTTTRTPKAAAPSKGRTPIVVKGPGAQLNIGNILGTIAVLPQNPDFTIKFDPGAFAGSLLRPTKTVIVSQDPAPGDFVPSGTPITVTVVEKSLIPSKSFPGLAAAVANQYTNIGALEEDLSKPNDPVATNAKAVLDKGLAFAQLTPADQTALTTFVSNRLGTSATDPAKAASDISFLYQL